MISRFIRIFRRLRRPMPARPSRDIISPAALVLVGECRNEIAAIQVHKNTVSHCRFGSNIAHGLADRSRSRPLERKYFTEMENPPGFESLDQTQRLSCHEGRCRAHVEAIEVAIDQYAEAAFNRSFSASPQHRCQPQERYALNLVRRGSKRQRASTPTEIVISRDLHSLGRTRARLPLIC